MGFWGGVKSMFTGVDTSGLKEAPGEALDPESQANLQRSIGSAESLRRAKSISGMQAGAAGDAAIRRQARATKGVGGEAQAAGTYRGAGLGSQILGKYGPGMAGEAVGKFETGLKSKQIGQSLKQGQILHSFAEKVKNYLTEKGVDVGQSAALGLATGSALAFGAELYGEYGGDFFGGDDDDDDDDDDGGMAPPWIPPPRTGRD